MTARGTRARLRPLAWFGLMLAMTACSQPDGRRERPPERVFVGALGDREHPVELTVSDDLAQARATAPGAGTWWYRVRFVPRGRYTSRLTISASHVAYPIGGHPERVRVDAFDGAQAFTGGLDEGRWKVSIPERPEPIAPLLVRVTTTQKARFDLEVFRESTRLPDPPPPPPCDHYHLDPANPNCAGVSPHCNLEDPDFTNPDCCVAACELGALRCRAKVISAGASAAEVAIGKTKHIMRFATGRLYQGGVLVSDVLVLGVEDARSFVKILSPHAVDATKLAENGEVVLGQPEACRRGRP